MSVSAIGEGWLGRTRVGVSPEHRSTAMLLSVPAALLFVCRCDSVCCTITLSVTCLSARQNFCSSDEETGDLYPQCLPVHLYPHWLYVGSCSLH